MSKEHLYKFHPRFVRITLNEAVEKADIMIENERQLISVLLVVDANRLFIRYGFKSLLGFCNHGLKLTRTQSQRLVTEVRQQQMRDAPNLTRYTDGKHRDFASTSMFGEQVSFNID